MVHVAKEMQRTDFEMPLLIGGATTSKAHTAVKIEQCYEGATVHVLDASRAVGVLGTLLDRKRRDPFVAALRVEYEEVRRRRADQREKSQLLSLGEARARAHSVDWSAYHPPAPASPGVHHIDSVSVAELRPYIDWTPFFQAWELHGKYPAILDDATVGEQARSLYADALAMLDRIESEELLATAAVVGLFPANADGDDVRVFADDSRTEVRAVVHGLRQQFDKGDRSNLCLSDFIAPSESGRADWIGAFTVTAGIGVEEFAASLEAEHDDYSAILVKALADRLAEAFAERMHQIVRTDLWGHAPEETLDNSALIAERFVGIRPAPGYPACPDHTEKRTLFDLLDVERRVGVSLTESYAMTPVASVSGWYLSHPDAQYFGVGRLGRDQVRDYAERKGWSVQEAERWLSPNLGYTPEDES
jgi:5-methyltetrahydrofolate--homocysteine methyltransferase